LHLGCLGLVHPLPVIRMHARRMMINVIHGLAFKFAPHLPPADAMHPQLTADIAYLSEGKKVNWRTNTS